MSENNILGGLAYLSILFAPFLLPFIIWLLTNRQSPAHDHAKRAFLLHLVPVILTVILLIAALSTGFLAHDTRTVSLLTVAAMAVGGLIDFLFIGYNLYAGLKLLVSSR